MRHFRPGLPCWNYGSHSKCEEDLFRQSVLFHSHFPFSISIHSEFVQVCQGDGPRRRIVRLFWFRPSGRFRVLPEEALAVGRAEFLPVVVRARHAHHAAAPRAEEGAQDRAVSLVLFPSRMTAVCETAAGFRAVALVPAVRGERLPALGADFFQFHMDPQAPPAGKWARKKGRVKSSLCLSVPGRTKPRVFLSSAIPVMAGALYRFAPPPHRLYGAKSFLFAVTADGAHAFHLLFYIFLTLLYRLLLCQCS